MPAAPGRVASRLLIAASRTFTPPLKPQASSLQASSLKPASLKPQASLSSPIGEQCEKVEDAHVAIAVEIGLAILAIGARPPGGE